MHRLAILALVALSTAAVAPAQNFNQCGTVEAGVTCPRLFRADDQTLWLLDMQLTGFAIGTRLRVVGDADPSCINICQQGNGCIFNVGLLPCTPIMPTFCSPGVPNSTGLPGTISATGSQVIANDDLTLTAEQLPQGSFAFFITSQMIGAPISMPGSSFGDLCLRGSISRFQSQVGLVDASGTYRISTTASVPPSQQFDLGAFPSPTGTVPVQPGETWHFQCWHRDFVGATTASNFTEGFSITFQ